MARPKQEDMPRIRRRMMKELMKGLLNPAEGTDIFDVAMESAVS